MMQSVTQTTQNQIKERFINDELSVKCMEASTCGIS